MCPMPGTKWPTSGMGSPGISSILWTAMTGLNDPPACMPTPLESLSAWSCSSVCGTYSTLCRRSRPQIDAYIILGKKSRKLLRLEGVHEESVCQSIKCVAFERMKNFDFSFLPLGNDETVSVYERRYSACR